MFRIRAAEICAHSREHCRRARVGEGSNTTAIPPRTFVTAVAIGKPNYAGAHDPIKQVYRTPVDHLETLQGRVLQSWEELRVDDCRRAIDQVNDRLLAVVEHNGAQIDQLFRV